MKVRSNGTGHLAPDYTSPFSRDHQYISTRFSSRNKHQAQLLLQKSFHGNQKTEGEVKDPSTKTTAKARQGLGQINLTPDDKGLFAFPHTMTKCANRQHKHGVKKLQISKDFDII